MASSHPHAADSPREAAPARSYREAMIRLRTFQKTAKGAPAYSRFVNRRIGRHFAAVAYSWGMTPNQVTAVSAAFTFTAIVILAVLSPTVLVGLGVGLLLIIGYALDSADGQLARLQGGGSAAGEWLDHVFDSIKTCTIHAAVLICMFRYFDLFSANLLLIPLAFSAVAGVWFFVVILTDQLRRANAKSTGTAMPTSSTAAPVLRSLLVLPTDYGLLCLVFLTLGWNHLFLALYSLLLLGSSLFLVAALPTWYREMKSFATSVPAQRVSS